MQIKKIYSKVNDFELISVDEGIFLFENAPLPELVLIANSIREKLVPGKTVTWLIDRNVNITNVCISSCKFCNFHCNPQSSDSYITTFEQYETKIKELFSMGGNQLLLQGGLHPKLGLSYYCDLFSGLKKRFPELKLHALGPPEIVHISKIENLSTWEVLSELVKSGLDSLPGAGAEILSDRVRRIISPAKCSSEQWLNVMREAHKMNLITSATMMFGHIETLRERIEHIDSIRKAQMEKPEGSVGFIAFIPWIFQDKGTVLQKNMGIRCTVSTNEYIRMIAISRIMLLNIINIQPSWLTIGKETAQICLHAGANDFGSVMIEENVVSSAGAEFSFNPQGIQQAIRDSGFEPRQRNQKYEYV